MGVYAAARKRIGIPPDPQTDALLNALYEAGCDDAIFVTSDGRQHAFFARETASFGDAVGSAIRTVERTAPGLTVVHVTREEAVRSELAA